MKIVQLDVENLMRLRAARVLPDGAMVVVGGNNGHGKTSLLNAIAFALGGKALVPEEPVRRGATRAVIRCDLGDLLVTRTFTAAGGRDGGSLTITAADGTKVASPQKILDALASKLTFDPLEFMRLDARAQAAMLLQALGVDFTDLEKRAAALAEERKTVNREADRLEAEASVLAARIPEGTPEAPISPADIERQYQEGLAHNRHNAAARAELTLAVRRYEVAQNQKKDLESQLEQLIRDMAQMEAEGMELEERCAALADVDVEAIDAKHKEIQRINRSVEDRRELGKHMEAVGGLRQKSEELSAALRATAVAKVDRLAEVRMPVDGLTYEDGLLYNGFPLAQASAAEQLRVSVAVGVALAPEIKVFLVRDGSLLDNDSLALLGRLAEEAGAQVWVERVGKGEECQLVIEDGEVQGETTR